MKMGQNAQNGNFRAPEADLGLPRTRAIKRIAEKATSVRLFGDKPREARPAGQAFFHRGWPMYENKKNTPPRGGVPSSIVRVKDASMEGD